MESATSIPDKLVILFEHPAHAGFRAYGYKKSQAHTGAVTLIQRFGGALNLNIHFHMLFLDGVYEDRGGKLNRFRWVKAPGTAELSELTHTIAHRIGRFLERQGLLITQAELQLSGTGRIRTGPKKTR